jgi:hypothetical protein
VLPVARDIKESSKSSSLDGKVSRDWVERVEGEGEGEVGDKKAGLRTRERLDPQLPAGW